MDKETTSLNKLHSQHSASLSPLATAHEKKAVQPVSKVVTRRAIESHLERKRLQREMFDYWYDF